MGFTVKKGSEKGLRRGSEKGLSRRDSEKGLSRRSCNAPLKSTPP